MIGRWLRRIGYWWQSGRHADALAEEMEHHRALIQAEGERGGLTPAEAERASRRAMGNVALVREDARDVWILRWWDAARRDARHGLRSLGRESMFAATAIITLALGVAATTTVFSVADAEVWKALPYPDPDRLVVVTSTPPGESRRTDMLSGADMLALRAGAPALSSLTGIGMTTRRVVQLDTARPISVAEVSADYFEVFGRRALAGRTFQPQDARGRRALVFTNRGWRRLFDRDPSGDGALVESVVLDGETVAVAGIVEADDRLGPSPDAYLTFDESAASYTDPAGMLVYHVVGRLAPDASLERARAQAAAAVSSLADRLRTERRGHVIRLEPLESFYGRSNARPLFFFLGASVLVLVLAAVNIAVLLVGRALKRRREFALRGALGGGLPALGRQLTVEGVLLVVPAGVIGLVVTMWLVSGLEQVLPEDLLLRGGDIPVDLRVAGVAILAMVAVTTLLALVPLGIARTASRSGIAGDSARVGRSRADGRLRGLLLAAQVALTMVLVSGAGLFVRSYLSLTTIPLGFDPAGVVTTRVTLGGPRYQTDDAVRAFAATLLERTRAVPGVGVAAVATSSPLGSGPPVNFAIVGRPRPAPEQAPRAILRGVSAGYFDTLGIRLVRGRLLADTDTFGSERVAVVNQAFVDQNFPDEDPIGQVIDLLPGVRAPWARRPGPVRIVGVVVDTKEVGLNEVSFANLTMPFAQVPSTSIEAIGRVASGASSGRVEAVRDAAAHIDPSVPVISAALLADRVEAALEGDRFNLITIGTFAVLAIVIAAVGVYGVAAHRAQARRREFGIRMAVGASPRGLVTAALGDAATIGAAGAGVGLIGVFVIARLLGNSLYLVPGSHNGLLFGVTTTDPLALGIAAASVVVVVLAAAFSPARRVGRLDPVSALRDN